MQVHDVMRVAARDGAPDASVREALRLPTRTVCRDNGQDREGCAR
jgi:hypothetical protein